MAVNPFLELLKIASCNSLNKTFPAAAWENYAEEYEVEARLACLPKVKAVVTVLLCSRAFR